MKNTILTLFLLATLGAAAQQNSLLSNDFWKSSPDVAAVKAEIAKGNDPAELNAMAFDPTVLAINNSASTETIRFLIEQPGNSVGKATHDSRIYLHWAASKGNVELIQYLIEKGSDLNLADSHDSTPIVFAANGGQANTAVYDAFFKAGVDPKAKYKEGANLLLIGIANDKDLVLTNYFASKGMSLKDVDNFGNTAINYVAKTGNIDLIKTLLTKGVKYTDNALIMAAQGARRSSNTIETYKYLVDALKLKPSVKSANGQTVLHYLANKEKQVEIVNYFIDKGVDANVADIDGNTALINAASGKDMALLELLASKATNINAANSKGETALTKAVRNSSADVVSFLLSRGANAGVLDKNGKNLAYHLVDSYKAPRPGSPDDFNAKMELLQKNGVNAVAAQHDGNTLLHVATTKNDVGLLKKLAGLKIDINAKNSEGMTALHKAAMLAQDDSILKYLISAGAMTNSTTEFDETALDLAKENELLTKKNVALDFLK